MIENFFAAVTNFAHRHKFLNNAFLRRFVPIYQRLQYLTASRVGPVANTIFAAAQRDRFLAENPGRVEAVANMLADEKSRYTYLGMVKFRQSGLKKDFPAKYYNKKQYFVNELRLGGDEVFIDCGAFTGDTLDEFIKRCGGYKAVIAFEPDPQNFQKLEKKYGAVPNVTLINAGAYDKDGEIEFNVSGSGGTQAVEREEKSAESPASAASGGNIHAIQVRAIDGLESVQREKITFIKMDVEGAEMSALKGAEKTIARDKPKLAISIYHSNEDMVRIAEYIHGLVPEYKLYVGQHMLFPSCGETVLYAVMP